MKNLLKFSRSSLFILYVISFVFTFTGSLPYYINSSFLSGLTSERIMSVIYAVASALVFLSFIYAPAFFKKYGNYKTTSILAILNIAALFGLALTKNPYVILLCFFASYFASTVIALCLDIFVEHNSPDSDTGEIRSVYLTGINIAWLVSPWLSGLIVGTGSYGRVYLTAALVMIPTTLMIITNLKGFKDAEYKTVSFVATIREIWSTKDIRNIFATNFLLQFFFAWMAIYTPIYLNKYVGFDWVTIGLIFTIMLAPFVFIEMPAGELADKKYGEKELLSIGFVVMAIATAFIPLVDGANFWIWALLLFMTRVGAAIVQVMSDVYFFKKTSDADVHLISMYRLMAPLAYAAAPVAAFAFLAFFKIEYLFFALGFLMLFGLTFSISIKDTK